MNRVKAFCREHRYMLVLLGLILAERLVFLLTVGPEYYIASDDGAYVQAGILFARTGRITIHETVSAQIMPGMPVFIGLVCKLVGEGTRLWLALKLIWIALGTLTPWLVYRSVGMFAPRWCALAAAACFLAPNFVWLDNLILTETPFLCFLAGMVYCTLRMAQTQKNRYFWGTLIFYMCALMLKANIGLYPVFAAGYLLVKKYPFKRLLRQGIGLGCVMLCFLIPWSIRNYRLYDSFIPLTFGTGNPKLLGTYQGYGNPEDAGLDWEAHVDAVAAERFAKYYNPDGSLKAPHLAKYIALERDGIHADYRLDVWWDRDPVSLLISYLLLKPAAMLVNVFYWEPVFGVPRTALVALRGLELAVCLTGTCLLLLQKRHRAELALLWSLYGFHLYLYAVNFSFSRYGESLIVLRYLILGLALGGFASLIKGERSMKENLRKLVHDNRKLLQAAAVLAVCLLAFGYAMLYVETHYKMSEAYTPDEGHYIDMAKRLLDGGGYSFWGKGPDAYVSPGYPIFLTVCMGIFGTSLEGLHMIKIVQAVLWALTVYLTWLLAVRITGKFGVGLAAALLIALNGSYAFYTRFLLTEIFYYFTMMLAFVVLHRALEKQTSLWLFLAGVCFAVCVMVRPLVVVVLPVAFLPWIIRRRRELKELARGIGCFALGFVLVCLPWWIRNLVTMGRVILLATQSNPIYAGLAPDIASRGIPDPGGILPNLLLLLKLFLEEPAEIFYWMTMGKFEIMFTGSIGLPRYQFTADLVRNIVVYLGLTGGIFALWDKKLRWPAACFWLFFLATFAFVPTVRYSLQYLPLLAILTGWLCSRLWKHRKTQ